MRPVGVYDRSTTRAARGVAGTFRRCCSCAAGHDADRLGGAAAGHPARGGVRRTRWVLGDGTLYAFSDGVTDVRWRRAPRRGGRARSSRATPRRLAPEARLIVHRPSSSSWWTTPPCCCWNRASTRRSCCCSGVSPAQAGGCARCARPAYRTRPGRRRAGSARPSGALAVDRACGNIIRHAYAACGCSARHRTAPDAPGRRAAVRPGRRRAAGRCQPREAARPVECRPAGSASISSTRSWTSGSWRRAGGCGNLLRMRKALSAPRGGCGMNRLELEALERWPCCGWRARWTCPGRSRCAARSLDALEREAVVGVELSAVSYIDSSGIAAWSRASRPPGNGRRFVLVAASDAVMACAAAGAPGPRLRAGGRLDAARAEVQALLRPIAGLGRATVEAVAGVGYPRRCWARACGTPWWAGGSGSRCDRPLSPRKCAASAWTRCPSFPAGPGHRHHAGHPVHCRAGRIRRAVAGGGGGGEVRDARVRRASSPPSWWPAAPVRPWPRASVQ